MTNGLVLKNDALAALLRPNAIESPDDRPAQQPALQACPHCGRQVLIGRIDAGEVLALALEPAVYALVHVHTDGVPRLAPSRAYVTHAALCKESP